jgi:phosphoribosylanthranilate isomerase
MILLKQTATTDGDFMTWIKICGITNLEDARLAVDAGADALGFVFYEKSPRNISPDGAREIVSELPEAVEKVGVIVSDASIDLLRQIPAAGLTAIQQQLIFSNCAVSQPATALGRDLFPTKFQWFISFPASFFLAGDNSIHGFSEDLSRLRIRTAGQPPLPEGLFETFFLDSGGPAHPGGTGEPFDWRRAVPIAEGMRKGGLKLVVAGGLTPDNVSEAMSILHPWGVDVSSGVETSPGKKDPEKIRAFIKAVRDADKANSN